MPTTAVWEPSIFPIIFLVEILLYACDFSEFLCMSHGGIFVRNELLNTASPLRMW